MEPPALLLSMDDIKLGSTLRAKETSSERELLTRSIMTEGQKVPVVVIWHHPTFILLHGHRRFYSHQDLGWSCIWAVGRCLDCGIEILPYAIRCESCLCACCGSNKEPGSINYCMGCREKCDGLHCSWTGNRACRPALANTEDANVMQLTERVGFIRQLYENLTRFFGAM